MQQVFSFLKDLCLNNNREWFDKNRDIYQLSKKEFEAFIETLLSEIQKFDTTIRDIPAKDFIFRIFRDTRFSHDKTPYKTNMGAFITPGGKKAEYAGYYFHIEPDNSFLAGGIYMPSPEVLKKLRQSIFENIEEFKSIINNPVFIKNFGKIDDSQKLKTNPKGFPKEFEDIFYLRFKNYTVMKPISDEAIPDKNLLKNVIEGFKVMQDFNSFLNKSLT